jgi:tRNA pseudouridine32 synthase/23S rRNA pseudouridine746 synthase
LTEALRLLPGPEGSELYPALDKPAGRAVHGRGGLLPELRELLGADVGLVHRLDRETSGVLLLARGEDALKEALRAWPERVSKEYVARTRGVPPETSGAVALPLLEHRTGKPELLLRALRAAYGPARAGHLLSGRRVGAIPPVPPPGTTAVHPAGRAALTEYEVLEDDGRTALVRLVPREGRMHQIRVHLAALGAPIANDRLYDPRRTPDGPPPLLHARRLTWREPPGTAAGTVWTWTSPLPS